MTKILNDGKRIIFDGHAETREQCELITLVCNELAKSDKFNTIQYNNAYAEFEKIGNTTDLKFAPASITIVFDGNINSVSSTLHNSTVTWSTNGASNMGAAIDGSYYVFNVDLKDGYVLDTVVLSDADTQAGVLDSKTDNSFTILAGVGGINQTITLTSKEAQSKKSIDLTTLSGWGALSEGSHNITVVAKADGYSDSEPSAGVTVTKSGTPTDCIVFTGETSDFTLKATYKEWNGTVEYSTDRTTWTTWNGTAISSSNKKLYLRGSGNTTFYTRNGAKFVLSAKAGCSGNLNTLLEYSNPPTTLNAKCYAQMFSGCTNLTTAPELPATTLAKYCYYYMFSGCTGLTTAPALPATTLADYCYADIFYNCTNLTTAPELPATTLKQFCYTSMFSNCTALKVSSTQTGAYQYAWRIPTSGTISSTTTNWNANMLANTGGTFKSDPSINTTYYVENAPV